jgi:nicotinate-nucleotide adenylyltransferase
MRVGLYGGSFNPAHEGHAHVADEARKALGLDKVIWLVSPQNPLKDRRETASLARRLAQTRKVAASPANIVTDLESRLGSAYTADTLRWLKRRYRGVRFVWIMGSDNLFGFHRWRAWKAIAWETDVAIVPRPGAGARAQLAPGGRYLRRAGRTRFLETPLHHASSTALRVRAMASR